MPFLISAGMPTLPFVICIKEKTLGQLAETRLCWAHWQLLWWAGAGPCSGCVKPSAATQADFSSDVGWLALSKGFDKYKTCFSSSYFWRCKTTRPKTVISVLDIHMFQCPVSLFITKCSCHYWGSSGFPPHLLREGKILKLQMQVLGNPRFPKVSLHFSKKNVNATRKTESQI